MIERLILPSHFFILLSFPNKSVQTVFFSRKCIDRSCLSTSQTETQTKLQRLAPLLSFSDCKESECLQKFVVFSLETSFQSIYSGHFELFLLLLGAHFPAVNQPNYASSEMFLKIATCCLISGHTHKLCSIFVTVTIFIFLVLFQQNLLSSSAFQCTSYI